MESDDKVVMELMPVEAAAVLTGERLGGALDGQDVMVFQFFGDAPSKRIGLLMTPQQVATMIPHILNGLASFPAHAEWAGRLLDDCKE